MKGIRSHLILCLLALAPHFSFSPRILAAESTGVVYNSCSAEPLVFTFSSLPDSCTVDLEPRCPQTDTSDLTLRRGTLFTPGGIMDLGDLNDFDLVQPISVPSAGYEDSLPFIARRLYALKVGERGFALFSEVRNFIGGCMNQEFRWRYNPTSNHFSQGPVTSLQKIQARNARLHPAMPQNSSVKILGTAGFDAKGRGFHPFKDQ